MAFVVIPDSETFWKIVDANQLPHLIQLGAEMLGFEIVLVESLRDELEADPNLSAYIRAHTPPFETVRRGLPPHSPGPYPHVHVEVTDYLTGKGKERIETGEDCILVVPQTGTWFWDQPPENVAIVVAEEGMVERIRRHIENGIESPLSAGRLAAVLEIMDKVPDPCDGMWVATEPSPEMIRWSEWFLSQTKLYRPRQQAWIARWMNRQLLQARQMMIEAGGDVEKLPSYSIGMPRSGEVDFVRWPAEKDHDQSPENLEIERESVDLIKADRRAFGDGLIEGRRQGANHALILDAEERVVEFAQYHFGPDIEIVLMEDGNVALIVQRIDEDLLERFVAFKSDLQDCIGKNTVVPVPILRTTPQNDLETKARARGRVLKGMSG